MVRTRQRKRLSSLHAAQTDVSASEVHQDILARLMKDLEQQKNLEERLSLAGFITAADQNRIKKIRLWVVSLFAASAGLFFLCVSGLAGGLISFLAAAYVATSCFFLWIAYRKKDSVRSIYYELPLVLEELVLLVESGLSLFPALEEVCYSGSGSKGKNSLVRKTLRAAYQLAAYGLPISQAFEQVARVCPFPPLRHVLLHLDISSNVGGELLHSLRTLSDQVHQEWKLAVETRIKRLENLVVFPVFASVMGLMMITAAVPLVPVLEYMSSMSKADDQATGFSTPATLQQQERGQGI
jgi:Flp pilus assembly protein TadB